MGFAEFIGGPAEGRTRWLNPGYVLIHRNMRYLLSIRSRLTDV